MTILTQRSAASKPTTLPILLGQLAAIDLWNSTRRDRLQALTVSGSSREGRLDASRQREALNRAHQALLAQLDQALAAETSRMQVSTSPTAVLAHRQQWFTQRVARALVALGVHVTAVVDNGADALGVIVAEQPHLLLVEEALPMLTGRQVLAEAAFFSPTTHIAVQVPVSDRIGDFLEAGARTVMTRQVPPSDVAQSMWVLLTASDQEPTPTSAAP